MHSVFVLSSVCLFVDSMVRTRE
uniref:Uncharacterized protein n=1 Tax=Rhizophora mucronata TaxID=61149 RepID=A0A2P2IW02_RHIMU